MCVSPGCPCFHHSLKHVNPLSYYCCVGNVIITEIIYKMSFSRGTKNPDCSPVGHHQGAPVSKPSAAKGN